MIMSPCGRGDGGQSGNIRPAQPSQTQTQLLLSDSCVCSASSCWNLTKYIYLSNVQVFSFHATLNTVFSSIWQFLVSSYLTHKSLTPSATTLSEQTEPETFKQLPLCFWSADLCWSWCWWYRSVFCEWRWMSARISGMSLSGGSMYESVWLTFQFYCPSLRWTRHMKCSHWPLWPLSRLQKAHRERQIKGAVQCFHTWGSVYSPGSLSALLSSDTEWVT